MLWYHITKSLSAADEPVQKLEKIGIDWMFPAERNWEDCYAAARQFYLAHGNLNVPVTDRAKDGLWLGRWVKRQQAKGLWQGCGALKISSVNGNQVARLRDRHDLGVAVRASQQTRKYYGEKSKVGAVEIHKKSQKEREITWESKADIPIL